jgi:hypothetical protein
MSALDTIKKYSTGDSVQSDTSETPAPTQTSPAGGAYNVNSPKGAGIKGDIPIDATETEEILRRMQAFIDQRESPFALLMGGLNKAYATTYGPSAALDYQKQQDVEDRQILDYRNQMAAHRSAQKLAAAEAADYDKSMGLGTAQTAGAEGAGAGAGAGEGAADSGLKIDSSGAATWNGMPIPPSVSARFKDRKVPGSVGFNRAIINDWLKTRTNREVEKELSPSMANLVEVFGRGQMPLHMAEKILMNDPTLQAMVNGKKVPLASVVSDAIKKDSAQAQAAAVKPPVPGATAAVKPPVPSATAAVKPPVAGAPVAAPAPAAPAPAAEPVTIKPSQVVTGPPEPPVASNYIGRQAEFTAAKEKWQKDYDTFNAIKQDVSKSNIASIKEEGDKFVAKTNPDILKEREYNNESLKNIIKEFYGNNNVAGILNEATWGNGILVALQKGIKVPGGSIALEDITKSLQRTRPNAKKEQIEAAEELNRIFGQRILDVIQRTKGGSSDKDMIAFKQIAGSAENGWDFIEKIQRYEEARLKADIKERALFENTYDGQTFNYIKHIAPTNTERRKIQEELGAQIATIQKGKYTRATTPPRPKNVPAGAMYNPQKDAWGWYDKDNKLVTNK